MMKKLISSAALLGPLLVSGAAHAACGDVTIAAFSWQSSESLAYVDEFILKNGYGCNASVITGETVPTLTSLVEKGQPDIVSESEPSLLPELVTKAIQDGRVKEVGTAVPEGSVSGWYIPKYLADAHPEIKTVGDALQHPDLFPAPEDPSKGAILVGPEGWGDTVVATQAFKAFDAESKGFTLVSTGSAAGLDGAIVKAYERKSGYLATYWSPTSLLQKYPMVRLEGGVQRDEAEWKRCTTVADCSNPKPNYWQAVPLVTLASEKFTKRDDAAPVLDYLKKRSWSTDAVSGVMAWMTDNQATGSDGARYFLKEKQDIWTKWVSPDVAEKIKSAL